MLTVSRIDCFGLLQAILSDLCKYKVNSGWYECTRDIKKLRMVMDFELLLGGQAGHVKCEQVQNAISQNRLKPIPISWAVSRAGQIRSRIEK